MDNGQSELYKCIKDGLLVNPYILDVTALFLQN